MNKTIRNFIATSFNVDNTQDYLEAAFQVLKLEYVCGQTERTPGTGLLHV
jgi:hypothetical protein